MKKQKIFQYYDRGDNSSLEFMHIEKMLKKGWRIKIVTKLEHYTFIVLEK